MLVFVNLKRYYKKMYIIALTCFLAHFVFCFKGYYDTLKIVSQNPCVENYQNKNSIISHL